MRPKLNAYRFTIFFLRRLALTLFSLVSLTTIQNSLTNQNLFLPFLRFKLVECVALPVSYCGGGTQGGVGRWLVYHFLIQKATGKIRQYRMMK
jgi:hypothetical protein